MKLTSHLTSPSVQLGLSIGVLMYCSYGLAHAAFANPVLALLSAFVGLFIPYYSKLSNKLEEIINLRTALVSLGRLGRFVSCRRDWRTGWCLSRAWRMAPTSAVSRVFAG
ncbi:hypothetical protein [Pseudomonas sp. LP_7_YM]|uniref:hypothetical protein n=1 Tax=Pseudomonas sp. LP_7_YM TaxID=2485137 RepID=UPI001061ACBE|nr:hypothetical protein [Pseudomonas sp. LP_7_YM]TDV60828.1 hypothetical protein EC915_11073 [Pseudomonas sp. LP_7_YM]